MTDCTDKSVEKKKTIKSDSYMFVVRNYTHDDIERIQSIAPPFRVMFEEEIGRKKKTPHLQGTIWHMFGEQFTMRTAEDLLGGRAGFVVCWAIDGSFLYCMKERRWWCNVYDTAVARRYMSHARKLSDCTEWLRQAAVEALYGYDTKTLHRSFDIHRL